MDGAHKYFQDISYRSQRRDLGTRFLRCDGCGEGGEREYGDVVFLTERLGSMGDLLRSLR